LNDAPPERRPFWVVGRPSKAAEFIEQLNERLLGKTVEEVIKWVLNTNMERTCI